ncbi:galactoside-binding soluble lectin 13-like [Pipistrellus kuhlii]|uniref:galactoside-binding soluble lectin 13-like n=1 Tax=Pipistrellus kuhlii TaxID=59472 RepID=UPI00174F1497|nr:galactoside-binding soluble lectin 13-like [Pipistrellus kuhlii]
MALLPVPYTKHVSLSVGSSVKIKGTSAMPFSMDPDMQVDFHTGNEINSGIAFCFRVYFGPNKVVMNTRQGGIWGDEETSTVMPFEDGQSFELDISVLAKEYHVSVNDAQCYHFRHRIEPGSVKMVQVWRDVSLTSVIVA